MASRGGSQQAMLRLGVLRLETNPARVVTTRSTFTHPLSGQSVRITPVPTVARPVYWASGWYGLHNKFDRVLFEDGWQPALQGELSVLQSMKKTLVPFCAHREQVTPEERQRFIGNTTRDLIESNMAFNSCQEMIEPPIDPRARRAIEQLLTLDPTLSVVMPWGMYHVPYLRHRLKQLGFVEKDAEDAIVIYQSEAIVLVGSLFVLFVLFPFYWFFSKIANALF
eukprot:PhM_4_TR11971/c0_g1_i1/m.83899